MTKIRERLSRADSTARSGSLFFFPPMGMILSVLLLALLETMRLTISVAVKDESLRHVAFQYYSIFFRELVDRSALLFLLQLPMVLFLLCASGCSNFKKLKGVIIIAAIATGSYPWIILKWYTFHGNKPQFLALATVFALSVQISWLAILSERAKPRPLLQFFVAATNLALFIFIRNFDTTMWVGLFPGMHAALLVVQIISLQQGIVSLLLLLLMVQERVVLLVKPAATAMALLATFSFLYEIVAPMDRDLLAYAVAIKATRSPPGGFIGEARTEPLSHDGVEYSCKEQHKNARDPQNGSNSWNQVTNYPQLGDGLDLSEMNVLFVLMETVRYDSTSLYKNGPQTTNFLTEMERAGSFVFERAYSSAPGSLQSVVSLLTMNAVSFTNYRTDIPEYCGALLGDDRTVAEIFRGSGYTSFVSTYKYITGVSPCEEGLWRGFDVVDETDVISENIDSHLAVDSGITEAAIARMGEAIEAGEKFLGFLYYFAPHGPYIARKEGTFSAKEKYVQEVEVLDHEIRKLFEYLKQKEINDNTIVIVTADHGQGFGEHGGSGHGYGLYEEQVHVPLVVRVPGNPGGRVGSPVSIYYALPWLMSKMSGALDIAGLGVLENVAVPQSIASERAVVVENVTRERMQVALIWMNEKIIADLRTGVMKVFDLESDPDEMSDLYLTDREQYHNAKSTIDRYLKLRACRRNYTFSNLNHATRK